MMRLAFGKRINVLNKIDWKDLLTIDVALVALYHLLWAVVFWLAWCGAEYLWRGYAEAVAAIPIGIILAGAKEAAKQSIGRLK